MRCSAAPKGGPGAKKEDEPGCVPSASAEGCLGEGLGVSGVLEHQDGCHRVLEPGVGRAASVEGVDLHDVDAVDVLELRLGAGPGDPAGEPGQELVLELVQTGRGGVDPDSDDDPRIGAALLDQASF